MRLIDTTPDAAADNGAASAVRTASERRSPACRRLRTAATPADDASSATGRSVQGGLAARAADQRGGQRATDKDKPADRQSRREKPAGPADNGKKKDSSRFPIRSSSGRWNWKPPAFTA